MNKELKQIKKLYGEEMMHFCRDNFALILDTPNLLLSILTSNFHPTHELYHDLEKENMLISFKNFIFKKFENDNNKDTKIIEIIESPEDLMAKAGYDLYECLTEDDIQKFRKYYAKGEELCTFWTNRLEKARVFFAVKKNVEEIKRENFSNPSRQDEYGTSVISIQFTKDGTNTLSIKNRYNHTVRNPDATFSNNLDNIIPGLTDSFEEYCGLRQLYKNEDFEIPSYVKANDGKYYKYNYENANIYYCPDNIIIDNYRVQKYAKEKYLIFDHFILDLEKKQIKSYSKWSLDSFPKSFGKIKRIEITNINKGKRIIITNKNEEIIEIGLDKLNRIISYKNNYIKSLPENFLFHNRCLAYIEINNAEILNDGFLFNNEELKAIFLPNVEHTYGQFLRFNDCLELISMPNLKSVGDYFLFYNVNLKRISLPKLETAGDDFLRSAIYLEEAYFPNLEKVGKNFLNNCQFSLKVLEAPKLEEIENLHPNLQALIRKSRETAGILKK